jgi:hypothetical protein
VFLWFRRSYECVLKAYERRSRDTRENARGAA